MTSATGIAAQVPGAHNLAGETTLREFIALASVCRLFLTNDSGAMHIASAARRPYSRRLRRHRRHHHRTHRSARPRGARTRRVRPCLLRECPIDHRCMTRVTPDRVLTVGRELLERTEACDRAC